MVPEAQKDEIYSDFAGRLNGICDEIGIPSRGRSQQLAKMTGLKSYKGAEKWTKGLSMPDVPHGTALAKALGVYFEYLMTGRGPKFMGAAPLAKVAEPPAEYNIGAIVEIVDTVLDQAGIPEDDRIRKQPLYGEFLQLVGEWYHKDRNLDREKIIELLRIFKMKG